MKFKLIIINIKKIYKNIDFEYIYIYSNNDYSKIV